LRIWFFSFLYRFVRYLITNILYFFQFIFLKQKNLEPAIAIGDRILGTFSIFSKIIYDFPIPKGKTVGVYDLEFPSPIISASFKSEPKILDMWLRMGIGGITLKTIMANKKIGNPFPRIQDIYYKNENGLINSLGLPGPGISDFIIELLGSSLWNYNRPIGISIGGNSKEEYIDNIKQIHNNLIGKDANYFYEINISCPNTESGQTISEDLFALENILFNIRLLLNDTISVKVSPDTENNKLKEIAEICLSFDNLMINAGNTKYMKATDVGVRASNFSMQGGGISGSLLFIRTLEMIKLFSEFNLPIIATGGISTVQHIDAARENGALLFGMATSLVFDPYCIPLINSRL